MPTVLLKSDSNTYTIEKVIIDIEYIMSQMVPFNDDAEILTAHQLLIQQPEGGTAEAIDGDEIYGRVVRYLGHNLSGVMMATCLELCAQSNFEP